MSFRNPKRITPALLSLGLMGVSAPAWAADPPATFAAPVTSSTGRGPRLMATTDFNKDGISDIAVVNITDRTVAIQLGSVMGMLATQTTAPLPASITTPTRVVGVADITGDGNPDVAVVGDTTIAIYRGNGMGGFLSTTPILAQYPRTGLPFRGLAVGNLIESTATQELVTFQPSPMEQRVFTVTSAGPRNPDNPLVLLSPQTLDVAMADVTGDGHVDIVGMNAAGVMAVQAGDGAGNFPDLRNATTSVNATRLALGDVTGDGLRDLITAGPNFVSTTRNLGGNTYTNPVSSPTTVNATDLVLADFNLDGMLDVAVASSGAPGITVLLNQGDGTFAQPLVLSTPTAASDIDVGDWNGDGRPDIVVTLEQSNTVLVFLNTTGVAADVAVYLYAQPILALLNPCIRYTVGVKNLGPDALDMATVVATLPAPLAAVPGQCTPGAGNATCGFGPLAPGAVQSRYFDVPLNLMTVGLPYTVTATRTASSPVDPNPANNQASTRCIVIGPLLTLCNI
jgi:hypothetical protein